MNAHTLTLILGGGDGGGTLNPPRPLDGYWNYRQILHAGCFPADISPIGYTPAERADAPLTCDACGELVRYAEDALEARRDQYGTPYTVLPDTTTRGWRKLAGGWESWETEVAIEETHPCPICEVPDALRREIALLYAGLREYIPQPLLHYPELAAASKRVILLCQECGGSGLTTDERDGESASGCPHCGGLGEVPCQCEECDERAAGRR